jgi:hypothetical protein
LSCPYFCTFAVSLYFIARRPARETCR